MRILTSAFCPSGNGSWQELFTIWLKPRYKSATLLHHHLAANIRAGLIPGRSRNNAFTKRGIAPFLYRTPASQPVILKARRIRRYLSHQDEIGMIID